MEHGLANSGRRAHTLIPDTETFRLMCLPTTPLGKAKVRVGKGIKIRGIFYWHAAFRDPRFQPLSVDELTRTRIEVSLLEAAQPFAFSDEADALARLRPGVDGLILHYGQRRATFLPQVWESLPKPRQFLQQLKLKAGLSADFWDREIRLARYGVQKWKET